MLASYFSTLRSFDGNVRRYLIAISLLGFTVDGGIYSVVFNLFLLRLGFGPDVIGEISFTGLIAFAINSLIASALGRRWGNRRLMLVGLSLMMTANVLLPFVDLTPRAWWRLWIGAAVVLSNIGVSTYFVNAAPYLMATTTPGQRNHAVSIQSAAIALAAFVGSLIGGVLPGLFAAGLGTTLAAAAPYRYTLLLGALMLNVGIFALLGAQNEAIRDAPLTAMPRRLYATRLRVPRLRLAHLRHATRGFFGLLLIIGLIRVLQIGGMAVTMTFFNVYLDTHLQTPTAQIGLVAGFARLASVPVMLAVPLLAARWGLRRVSFWASAGTALAVLLIAGLPVLGAAGLGYMGVMASGAIRYTTFMLFTMELVQPEQRSLLSGISEMTAGLSFAIMSLVGGQIIVSHGFQTLFVVGATASLIGTLLFWACFGLSPQGVRPIVASRVQTS